MKRKSKSILKSKTRKPKRSEIDSTLKLFTDLDSIPKTNKVEAIYEEIFGVEITDEEKRRYEKRFPNSKYWI